MKPSSLLSQVLIIRLSDDFLGPITEQSGNEPRVDRPSLREKLSGSGTLDVFETYV